MKHFLFTALLLLAGLLRAQDTTVAKNNAAPPDSFVCAYPVDILPQFPGGEKAMADYVRTHIHYPDSAAKYGKQGTVYVSFDVGADGSTGNFRVKRGVNDAPELDAEALRVLQSMPEWEPGKVNGKYVKTEMTVPVKFVLPDTVPSGKEPHPVVAQTGGNPDSVYPYAQKMPAFPGGQKAFEAYFRDNIVYPKQEKKEGKEGTVYVAFVVNKDGSIDSVRLIKGVLGAPGLGEEAVRVVGAMPAWEPGRMDGKPVRVQLTIPVKYTLAGKKKKSKK